MGDYASRKKRSDEASTVLGAPGMEAFWAGVAKGTTPSLVDPRVPGTAPDHAALMPYIDHDYGHDHGHDHDHADPVAMATKITAQLTASTARAKAYTRARKAQPYVDALVAAMNTTDERDGRFAFLRTLDRLDDPELRETVLATFQAQTGRPLSDVIATSEWHGGRDKTEAQALISPARAKTEREMAALPPDERATLRAEARVTATAIADVIGRSSSDDKASAQKIHRALAGKTPMQIEAIRAAVREQTRGTESLYEQLDRSLSGDDEDEAVASLTGDPVYAASIALQNAIGDAPRIVEILRALRPAQVASLKQRFPAATFAWMSVPADQRAEIGELVNGSRSGADGAKVADLLRDPLRGAVVEVSGGAARFDAQSEHDQKVRSTDNVLRELEKMSPAQLVTARASWDASAKQRGEKTWDAMIEDRFGAGDPLTYLRVKALASGDKVDALALAQGVRDHDQATIDAALANPDLSSADPKKRAAAREHAAAVNARFQDIDANTQRAIAAGTGGDVASARGDSLDTALVTLNPAAMAVIDALVGLATIYVKADIQGEAYKSEVADLLDTGLTVLSDLAMLPIAKLETTLARTAAVVGLSSGTIVVRNEIGGRSAETALDLIKNLVLVLGGMGTDKLQDAVGGVAGKATNILGSAAGSGALYGGDATTLIDAGGGHLAKGRPARRPRTVDEARRIASHPDVIASGHYADVDDAGIVAQDASRRGSDVDRMADADARDRLPPEDRDDIAKLAELRRRRERTTSSEDAASSLEHDIAVLERKLGLHEDSPGHAARRRAVEHQISQQETPNDDSRYQTRAELVPGSEFRGRGERRGGEVHDEGMAAIEATLRRYPDVDSVEVVDATKAKTAEKRAHLEATYLVTLKPDAGGVVARFTIRLAVGPHEGQTVARTVINPSQEGRNRTKGSDALKVRGRYVIQLSDEVATGHVERAVAHEIAELRAVRDLHDQGRYAGVDALRPGSVADELSPHDLGRVAELDVLARSADPTVHSHARTEILALVEHMGLRAGEPGADARFELAKQHMAPETAHVVDALRKPLADLPEDVAVDLQAVKERAARDHADERGREVGQAPAHDLPSTLDENGHPMSRDALAARAAQAAAAREAKSDETWSHLGALVAASPEEPPLLPFEVQIGGGVAIAARDRGHLVIDDRGRWQADGNHEIAQTATQSRGTKDANLGDSTEVAKPDRRVPTDAISYWEDNIAAQGPVVNGRASLGLGANDELLLTITKDGQELTFRVSKPPTVATGFPPEKLTGSKYGRSVRETAVAAQTALTDIAVGHSDETVRQAASEALAKIKDTRLVTNEDAVQLGTILQDPRLRDAIAENRALADSLLVSAASQHWQGIVRADDPIHRHVFLGDWANIGREHALRAHNWVAAGTGGTAVSAVEIVLGENPKAHVTMVGADEPDGLMENDQFLTLARRHADAALAARLDIPPGDGRLSVADPQYVGRVEASANDGTPQSPTWVDESDIDPAVRSKHLYDVNGTKTNARGTAYIAAIGRENDYPPIVAALLDDARRKGHQYFVTPRFHDRQYVHGHGEDPQRNVLVDRCHGRRLALRAGNGPRSVDPRGSARLRAGGRLGCAGRERTLRRWARGKRRPGQPIRTVASRPLRSRESGARVSTMRINDVYREICDNPRDDEPRLRFADLIEPSEPRWARFIRDQIDKTLRMRRGDTGTSLLTPKEAERWAASLLPFVAWGAGHSVEFHRGFPALVSVHPGVFAEYGEQFFRLAPIRHVDFVHPYDENKQPLLDEKGDIVPFPMDTILSCPALSRLETIGFINVNLPRDWARKLAACPYLANCHYLSLAFSFHLRSELVELLESPDLRKMIHVISHEVGKQGEEKLGLQSNRSHGQGGPEETTYFYGALTKELEKKYGYIPWLHSEGVDRLDLHWYIANGRYPKFPAGSMPPKEEWYELPKPIYHPATW